MRNQFAPTIGPTAMATPAVAPHTPKAFARSDGSLKVVVSSDRVAGKMNAAAAPSTRAK